MREMQRRNVAAKKVGDEKNGEGMGGKKRRAEASVHGRKRWTVEEVKKDWCHAWPRMRRKRGKRFGGLAPRSRALPRMGARSFFFFLCVESQPSL